MHFLFSKLYASLQTEMHKRIVKLTISQYSLNLKTSEFTKFKTVKLLLISQQKIDDMCVNYLTLYVICKVHECIFDVFFARKEGFIHHSLYARLVKINVREYQFEEKILTALFLRIKNIAKLPGRWFVLIRCIHSFP